MLENYYIFQAEIVLKVGIGFSRKGEMKGIRPRLSPSE